MNHWYHQSCIAHMYEEMGKELPEQHYEWARECIEKFNNLPEDEKEDVNVYGLVIAFGIHYGIRRLLERAYIAFPQRFHHSLIDLYARKLALTNAIDRYNKETTCLRMALGIGSGIRYRYGDYHIHVNHPNYLNERDYQQINAYFVKYDENNFSTNIS